MTNRFDIVIGAQDRASAVVDKVTSALGRVRGPITGIRAAVEQLGDATGLAALGRGVSGIGGMVREAAGSLGVLGGSMGLVAGAGSVAGVAALVSQWGQVGVATANAAGGIGIAAGRLRTLQGAAGLAGLSADAMTGSLSGLAATLQDAAFGRSPAAAAMLNTLGIRMHRTAAGAVDAERAMGDLAEAIARQTNPQTQARIAQMFGVEQLLPMLRQGRAGWTAYLADVQRFAGVSQETQEQSEGLGRSLNRLRAAVAGVGVTLEARYGNRFGGIIDRTAEWVAANKPLAAGLGEVGVALGVVALAARAHPVLGLITGIVQGALLIHEHWDGLGDFVRGEMDKMVPRIREQTPEERREQEESGWPSWLPRIRIGKPAPPPAAPAEKPATVTPPAAPAEDKPWWQSLVSIKPANAATPPPAPPAAPPPASPAPSSAVPPAIPSAASRAEAPAGAARPIALGGADVEALTRVAIAEAGNQGALGLEGVVRTILNRVAHPAWGGSVTDVVNARNQFEPVTRAGGDWRNLPAGGEPQRAMVRTILEAIQGGRSQDPTDGATYFLNRDISNRRGTDFGRGRDALRSAEIGDHTFYRPGVFGERPTPVPDYSVLLSDLAKGQARAAAATQAPAAPAGQPGGGSQAPIQVEVRFSGQVPPGTTATVHGQDLAGPARIDYSLPDFARP